MTINDKQKTSEESSDNSIQVKSSILQRDTNGLNSFLRTAQCLFTTEPPVTLAQAVIE